MAAIAVFLILSPQGLTATGFAAPNPHSGDEELAETAAGIIQKAGQQSSGTGQVGSLADTGNLKIPGNICEIYMAVIRGAANDVGIVPAALSVVIP